MFMRKLDRGYVVGGIIVGFLFGLFLYLQNVQWEGAVIVAILAAYAIATKVWEAEIPKRITDGAIIGSHEAWYRFRRHKDFEAMNKGLIKMPKTSPYAFQQQKVWVWPYEKAAEKLYLILNGKPGRVRAPCLGHFSEDEWFNHKKHLVEFARRLKEESDKQEQWWDQIERLGSVAQAEAIKRGPAITGGEGE